MTDPSKTLFKKYSGEHRYANFGSTVRKLTVNGFRGINGLTVEFGFPIVAVSGLNGAGKSTIGQLCLSAYRKPTTATDYKRFYVRDFFPASIADPNPFAQDSEVLFEYETDDPDSPQSLTVKRVNSEWSGYKRQPERKCFYVGFTIYIPKVERKDVSIYRGHSLTLTNQRAISEETRAKVGGILGQQYENLHFQGIQHGKKSGELGIAEKFGCLYSENNMGFGEGRTLYLVDLLENSPEQSLFVIEEPETSLHEHAQHQLAKYLLDVCNRRHHQIILSTHSDKILDALPSVSRVLLHRDRQGVETYSGLSSTRARALLSLGRQRDLVIFVEDDFAKLLLAEFIRRVEPNLLRAVDIQDVGDTKAVRNAVLLLQRIGKNCMAVRDADTGPDIDNNIFSFPGDHPPEIDVYCNENVKQLLNGEFDIDVDNILALRQIDDHHLYTNVLAEEGNTLPDYLRTIAIKAYIDSLQSGEYEAIVTEIRNRA